MASWKEMINKTYGDMLVLRRATVEETPWKSHATPLWVKCSKCGHEWSARKEDIEKNKSCPFCTVKVGRGHINDITGQVFGYLTVLNYDYEGTEKDNGKAHWLCQCKCGNIISVRLAHLLGQRHSPTISCGCATRSSGEINTQNALDFLNLRYNIEVIVPECHKFSPFDIEVIDNKGKRLCFFECDGEQHFRYMPRFHEDKNDFIHQQEIDHIKDAWCKNHQVPLFRIPYTEYTQINGEYLKNRFPEFKKLLESL